MSEQEKKRFSNNLILQIHIVPIILLLILWYYNWMIGAAMTVVLGLSFWIMLQKEEKRRRLTEKYIATLSYRVKKVSEEALLKMPFGIVLYSDDYEVEWSNPFMNQFSEEDTFVGDSLQVFSEDMISEIKKGEEEVWLSMGDYIFKVVIMPEERILYFFDRTEQRKIESKYEREQPFVGIIFLDNYQEITRNMEDAARSELNSMITTSLNNWAHEHGLYLKRFAQARFLIIGTNEILQQLEETRFNVLDEIRELENEEGERNPVTLSIGIGYGDETLPALAELAQSSLDLALGRGGDQVAMKSVAGEVRFYGGKTNPMEKRTRVRARVISHALRDLVRESDQVIIMGHKMPDMDAIGAAIGVLNIAHANDKAGYIVLNPEDVNSGISRMVRALQEDEELWLNFITSEEAEEIITRKTLIVIVDTHKPSLVLHERLLKYTDYIVVIDHHRRSEDFIENPTLVYMEPYASSTCELVTELLEYQPRTLKLSKLEATSMLAGIIVDTNSFTLRTGSRTFDAASYLRASGADTVLVQRFMKEDFEQFVKRSELIQRARVFRDSIAIAVADEGEIIDHVLIAQAADTLLTMDGINASFVISERRDGKISISARSLGDVNVQVIMEQMEGGGHLTNAATQLEDITIHEAEERLKDILLQYFEGRD